MKEQVVLIFTKNNKDSEEMMNDRVQDFKMQETLAEFKKPDSKYKIAIVVDMLLTGFDVPDLDTMYIDKILK